MQAIDCFTSEILAEISKDKVRTGFGLLLVKADDLGQSGVSRLETPAFEEPFAESELHFIFLLLILFAQLLVLILQ